MPMKPEHEELWIQSRAALENIEEELEFDGSEGSRANAIEHIDIAVARLTELRNHLNQKEESEA